MKKVITTLGWLLVVSIGIGLSLLTFGESYLIGVCLVVVSFYLFAHIVFGPLDWYVIYKALKKLRR